MNDAGAKNELLISVVVRTYNRSDLLQQCLQSIISQQTDDRFKFEIVVVDNDSKDNTKRVVERIMAEASIDITYCLEVQKGPSHALNRGIEAATGCYFAFCDDDQTAAPDWLKELMNVALDQHAVCVGGAIHLDVPLEKRKKIGPVCRSILGEHPYDGPPRTVKGKNIPSQGNILIARQLIDRIGRFDPQFQSGGEDTDFIRRIQKNGFPIWICPRSVVFHHIPAYRLERRYFRWASFRWGIVIAQIDFDGSGVFKRFLSVVARSLRACWVHFPLMIIAKIRQRNERCLDYECLIWRAISYVRTSANLFLPILFSQKRFFERLEFRNEQNQFNDNTYKGLS